MVIQRYNAHLPAPGRHRDLRPLLVQPRRVEPVMGFCTPQETAHFLEQVPTFEKMLVMTESACSRSGSTSAGNAAAAPA